MVEPRLVELESAGPDDLTDEVATFLAAARSFGEAGDFAAIESADMRAAEQEINDYLFDSCPGERLDVVAIDYAFQGLPEEVAAGPVVVRFDNQGDEEHELIVVRRLPGTTEPLNELLAMSEEEVDTKIELVAAAGAAPGVQDVVVGLAEIVLMRIGDARDANGLPDVGDVPAHFVASNVAIAVAGMLIAGLLGATDHSSWKLPAWTAGLSSVLLGLHALVFDDQAAAIAAPWAFAAIASGVAYLVATVTRTRRAPRAS